MGYDDMEPNMKLSRALLIVLVLHVVAVSGIIAFNAIKTREKPYVPSVAASQASSTAAPAAAVNADKSNAPVVETRPAHPPVKSVAKEEPKPVHAKPVEHSVASSDPGKVYVVAKGDNPVSIAKKLKVDYDELIALNHIDDPRKMQIGAKLLIPKPAKGKKATE